MCFLTKLSKDIYFLQFETITENVKSKLKKDMVFSKSEPEGHKKSFFNMSDLLIKVTIESAN